MSEQQGVVVATLPLSYQHDNLQKNDNNPKNNNDNNDSHTSTLLGEIESFTTRTTTRRWLWLLLLLCLLLCLLFGWLWLFIPSHVSTLPRMTTMNRGIVPTPPKDQKEKESSSSQSSSSSWHDDDKDKTTSTTTTTIRMIRQRMDALASQLDGDVIWATDSTAFAAANTNRWITSSSSTSSNNNNDNNGTAVMAIVQVASPADVQRAVPVLVELQQRYHWPFSIRSGGHHKLGYSTVPAANGAVLSLQRLNQIQFQVGHDDNDDDTTHNNTWTTALLQPAVRDVDFARQLLATHGYGGVFGFCATVGMAGFAMGGGVGIQSRLYGLGLDQIQAAVVVLANGRSVNLTAAKGDTYSDLLWAVRGAGGGNFGVVTQFTYRIHRAWDELYVLTITLPSLVDDKAHGVTITANLMQKIGALEANDVLSRNVCIMYDGWDALHLIWSAADEVTFVQGRAYLQKLVNHRLGTAVAALPQQEMNIRWSDFYHLENIPVNKTSSWYNPVYKAGCWYGFLHPVNNTEAVWQEIMQRFAQAFRECPHLVPDVELWGGAIKDPLPNATAFPHRSAIYNVGVLLIVNTDENDDEAEAIFQRESAAVNAWWPRVAQYLTGSYLNYPTASLGADYPTAFWGNNLSRLRQVKQKYDPDNVFSFPMSVPL